MKKEHRRIKEKAKALGITTDELLEEMEVGSPDKAFTLTVRFARYEQLLAFAKALTDGTGLAVYRADALDDEFGGRAPQNSFVLRDPNGVHGKPDSWRVSGDYEHDEE